MKRTKDAPGLGFVPLARAVLRRPDLNTTDKVMLVAILDEAYLVEPRDGVCRASNKALGDSVGGLAQRSVIDSVARLEASGLIRRSMTNRHHRIGIEVLFDRFGGAIVGCEENSTPSMRKSAHLENPGYAEIRTPSMRKSAHQVCGNPHTHPIDNIKSIKTPSSTAVPLPSFSVEETRSESPLALVESTHEIGTAPGSISALMAWTSTLTDDPKVTRGVPTWVNLIQARLPEYADSAIDWVQDAVLKAVDRCDGFDDEKGGPSAYALACLTRWIAAGGRPHVEILQAQAKAEEDQGRSGREKAEAEKAEAKAAELAKADRDQRLKARWARLPARERDPIESAVIEANPSLRKFPSVIEGLCIQEMEMRHGRC